MPRTAGPAPHLHYLVREYSQAAPPALLFAKLAARAGPFPATSRKDQARCPSATQPRLAAGAFGLGAMPLLFSASRMMLRMLSLAAGPGANA